MRTLERNDDDLLEVGDAREHQSVVALLPAIRAQTVHIYALRELRRHAQVTPFSSV